MIQIHVKFVCEKNLHRLFFDIILYLYLNNKNTDTNVNMQTIRLIFTYKCTYIQLNTLILY